ncbi:MAG: adenylate/guanylate cyclase domain-containing protein [Candidatus Riflebacteria bacterium]|nr:adenylate/guanylate cyclase domain-containing protein [Candidatus Riflebacteria bacterium]
MSEGGVIDKLIGDKVLAYFIIDSSNKNDSQKGISKLVQSALREAQNIESTLALLLRNKNLRLGIGITAGQVLSGIMGVPEFRLEMTILDDTVNLASRLADLSAKEDAFSVLTDEAVAIEIAGNSNLEESPIVKKHQTGQIKGKKREVKIFRISCDIIPPNRHPTQS